MGFSCRARNSSVEEWTTLAKLKGDVLLVTNSKMISLKHCIGQFCGELGPLLVNIMFRSHRALTLENLPGSVAKKPYSKNHDKEGAPSYL